MSIGQKTTSITFASGKNITRIPTSSNFALIYHFNIRITLKTLHSFVKVPKFNAEQLNDAQDLDEIEFYNFQWQQKAFSSAEIRRYSNLERCKNERTKEYHQRITEDNRYLDENGTICYTGKIFSYVNDDDYHEPGDEHRTELAEHIQRFGQWKNSSDFGELKHKVFS